MVRYFRMFQSMDIYDDRSVVPVNIDVRIEIKKAMTSLELPSLSFIWLSVLFYPSSTSGAMPILLNPPSW